MRTRYHFDKESNQWVTADKLKRKPKKVHNVIQDTMDALDHPCTGEMIDSKSRFRRITKEHGCIEIGDDRNFAESWRTPREYRPVPGLGKDLRRVIYGE